MEIERSRMMMYLYIRVAPHISALYIVQRGSGDIIYGRQEFGFIHISAAASITEKNLTSSDRNS